MKFSSTPNVNIGGTESQNEAGVALRWNQQQANVYNNGGSGI